MKYCLVCFALFIFTEARKPKAIYLDEDIVMLNSRRRFIDVAEIVDFKKAPRSYLNAPQMRFDKSTKIDVVEKMYTYQEATSGTDMDLYTTVFIQASKRKNGSLWTFIFDVRTHRLMRVLHSKTSDKLIFYKS